jgi:hypothetical protein
MIYEQPWHTFRLGHLKRADNEIAALKLAAWAREHHIQISFELRGFESVLSSRGGYAVVQEWHCEEA